MVSQKDAVLTEQRSQVVENNLHVSGLKLQVAMKEAKHVAAIAVAVSSK